MIIPIMAGVFYHWDVFVSPVWSSISMSCSSLLVVGFSHLLSFFHYDDSLVEENTAKKLTDVKNNPNQKDSSRMLRD
jgi:hypothetical protein